MKTRIATSIKHPALYLKRIGATGRSPSTSSPSHTNINH